MERRVSELAGQQVSLRVLVAGGGTGGHVIPAIAMARELRDRHHAEVVLLGTARGIEAKLVPAAGFPLELMDVGQLANVSLVTRLKTLAKLPMGVVHCIRLIRSFRPSVVIGVGGYASGPAVLAALLLRVPTMVYEPNAAPGMVNRRVGPYVSAAAVAYADTKHFFRNAQVTGVPVREEIFESGPLHVRPPRLLVTAGSNGAKIFNETLPRIVPALLAAVPGLTVWHQTGERAFATTAELYRLANVDPARIRVVAFLPGMADALRHATLVLARSGSTVAELAAAGRPALLVPFPKAADDHQTRNAEAMVRLGAAELLPETELTDAVLLRRLTSLLQQPDLLIAMGESARKAARPDALRRICNLAASLAGHA